MFRNGIDPKEWYLGIFSLMKAFVTRDIELSLLYTITACLSMYKEGIFATRDIELVFIRF